MRYTLASFVALFVSFGLLLTGGGMLGTLVGVRMSMEWFPTAVIGVITACYSVGFVIATSVCPRLIVRVGHIRAFAGLCAIAASSTLVYPLIIEPVVWGVMRVVYGFCVAGLYITVESWLNDRTPKALRGTVFGVYSVVTYVGLGSGQFLLILGEPRGFELFSISAMIIALALVPVTIMRSSSPQLAEVRAIRIRDLLRATPLGLVGAGIAGAINGGFLGMAPVYGNGVEFSSNTIALLMGVTILGGFLLQYPIGRVSDRYDRRIVIAVVACAVSAVSLGIALFTDRGVLTVIALSVLWGGLAFTLYPLTVSLTNDFVEPAQMLGASAALLMVHGLGMIAGPIAAALLMRWLGPTGLFWMLAAAALTLAVFAWVRRLVGPAIAHQTSSSYRVVPRNTPYASTFDPRAEELQLAFDFGDAEGE